MIEGIERRVVLCSLERGFPDEESGMQMPLKKASPFRLWAALLATAALATSLLLLLAWPQPARAADSPATNGKIAFSSNRDGDSEIYVMDADGSNQINLTNDPAADDAQPALSPDGSQIAFVSNRDSSRNAIYVMKADGSKPTRLTNDRSWNLQPTFSPDGKKIAYVCDPDDVSNFDICVINADGSGQKHLTTDRGPDTSPSFSADGRKIAFSTKRAQDY